MKRETGAINNLQEHLNNDTPIRLLVPVASVGQTVAELVKDLLGSEAAERVLERGGVWLGKQRVSHPNQPVQPGAFLTVHRPPAGQYTDVAITISDIIYEDEWLLVLDKRAGWYSGATPWDDKGNVLAALVRFLQSRDGVAPTLHLAHQLDRDTSGVLLVSKSPLANAPLQAAFASGAVHKSYVCVCAGEPVDEEFELRSGHGRSAGGRWRVYPLEHVGRILPGGNRVRLAHTRFMLQKRLDGAALLCAVPQTGRTHQIRLHLAALGYPLLGDARYGGPTMFRGQTLTGQLLHAARLTLPHPITSLPLDIQSALPGHLLAVM
ncbi:MAG: RluA family pseudouridine synthase [Chloroflexales bacterium]|nr:RluA family pseudouridine synthase [Chloroflexales bacterium]